MFHLPMIARSHQPSPKQRLRLLLAIGALALMHSGGHALMASTAGGIISGQFGVDRIGAATYEIPLAIPPGTAGVAPELSLNYDSHSPDGMLGVGWTLSGLSSITRCAVRRDGQNYPIDYSSNDRFCLDGDYLVASQGQVYGADGTTYHPEKQPWVRVRSIGSCPARSGSSPCSFVAEQPSGDRIEYGVTGDSAIEAVPAAGLAGFPLGAIRVWAAASYVDKSGNTIEFRYSENSQSGEYVPQTVLYTINSSAAEALPAQRAVGFEHVASTPVLRFQGGAQVPQSWQLARIRSCVNPAGLRDCSSAAGTREMSRYELEHASSPATQRDLLRQITRYGSDGSVMPTQRFEYQAPARNAFAEASSWTTQFTWDNGWSDAGSQERQVADVDGDGRYDLIGFGNSATQYALSTGSSFAAASSQPIFSRNQGYTDKARFPRLITDVNGDGLSDIIGFGNTRVQVSLSLGDRFAPPEDWSSELTYGNGGWDNTRNIRSVADINGDGRTDIIGFGTSTLVYQLSTGEGFAPAQRRTGAFTTQAGYTTPETHPRYMADVNGDGRADIVGFKSGGVVEVALSLGDRFGEVQMWTDRFVADNPSGWLPGRNPRYVLDLNNDGVADLIGFRDTAVVVAFGTGASFTEPQVWTTEFTFANGGWDDLDGTLRTLGDVDGDRLPDVIAFGNNDTRFGINRLDRFATDVFAPIKDTFGYSSIARNPRFPADTSGAGISALIGLGDRNVLVALPPGPTPDLMIEAVNEMGGSVSVAYGSTVGDPSVYRAGERVWQYPYRSKVGPLPVVARHSLSDGLGARYDYLHSYQGSVADLLERGFLGFERSTMTDLQLNPDGNPPGVATSTDYYIEFPLTGSMRAIESRLLQTGQLASRYEYEFAAIEVHPGVFDARKTAEFATHYSLSGPQSYNTRQSYAYDDYGNLQLLLDYGHVDDPADDSAVCVNFDNSTTPWRIGFPRDSATAASCGISAGECQCAEALTRDRWSYDEPGKTNTLSHAQYDSANQGWLGSLMRWDAYGNQIEDSGAFWSGEDPRVPPEVFNPLTITIDPVYRSFAIRLENALFASNATYEPLYGARLSQTDPNGVVTRFSYDGFGRQLSVTGPSPAGIEVTLSSQDYQALAVGMRTLTTTLIDWDGSTAQSAETVDGLGRLTRSSSEVDAACEIASEQRYLALDRLDRQSLPYYRSRDGASCALAGEPVWQWQTYDPLGRLQESIRADGSVTRYDVDIAELNGYQRDRVIRTAAYGSPEARRFSTWLDSDQVPLRWAFPASNPDDPEPLADLRYDALGRLVSLQAPGGNYSQWVLDSLSRVSSVSSANSGTDTLEYWPQGMFRAQTDADGRRASWTYDAIGRVQSESLSDVDGSASTIRFEYDQPAYAYPIGRLTSVHDPAQAIEHHYDYDPYGNRQQSRLVIDTLQFAIQVDYDPLKRAVLLTLPDGSQQRKDYAVDGFLRQVAVCRGDSECAAGRFENYASFSEYTALGSPQVIRYRDGRTASSRNEFDLIGRIRHSRAESAAGTALLERRFDWDRLDQLLASEDLLDQLRSLRYAYDGAGYVQRESTGGRSIEYGYDAAGNLRRKGDLSFTVDVTQVSSGSRNGAEVFRASYDAAGNMRSRYLVDTEGQAVQWNQAFDALGRMRSIERAGQDGEEPETVASFVYDYDDSLIRRVDAISGVTSYYISGNYDIALLTDGSAVHTQYVDGLNGIVASISASSPSLSSLQPRRMADRWLTPARLARHEGNQLTLAVLALLSVLIAGQRLRRRQRRLTRWLRQWRQHARLGSHVGLALLLLLAQTPTQAWANGLTPGPNGPGVPVAGQTLFYYTDQISSSVLVVDEAGEPRTRVSYDAFGAIDEGASFGENDFRAKFAGLELASEVDLYLNAGRFYDPLIGRFVSADANRIGTSTDTAVQFNRYAYGANNPVTHTDPTGGSAQSILFDIGLAAIAVAATVLVPGGGIIAVAEVGAYFGGAAVNHSYDPASWNYKSWQTYAGMAAGIAVSAAGLAISIAAPEAIPEEAGVLATFLAGVAVDSVVGFAENATFAALGGASRDEILKQGLIGAATGAAFSALGQGVSAGVSRIANRATRSAAEAGEESSSLGTRSAGAAERGEAAAGGELEVRGGCNASFAAGTLVATPEGRVPIESLPLRSRVLARAADDGRTELRMVTAVYQRNSEDGILLQMPGGEVLTTAEHPFLHADGYWLAASELSAGDLLYGESGPVPLLAVSWQPQPLAVHNLSVSGLQTFVVGPDGVVVHNVNHWCTSRNAADLRDNMNQSGQAEPNFQNSAHHIVESTDPSPYMVKARSHLQAMGIDINHAGNGVFLARSSRVQRGITKGKWRNAYPHSRVHTKAYKRTVWKTIKTAKNRTQTLAKLRGLRTRLLNGNLPGAQINWP